MMSSSSSIECFFFFFWRTTVRDAFLMMPAPVVRRSNEWRRPSVSGGGGGGGVGVGVGVGGRRLASRRGRLTNVRNPPVAAHISGAAPPTRFVRP